MVRKILGDTGRKELHVCYRACDSSHAAWNKYFPDDPILIGELIHHKDGNHGNNKKYNLQKMTHGKHTELHKLGSHHSEESKKKMSVSVMGKNNPMFGKTHSDEVKKKLSIAKSGRNHPFYGKHFSEDHKRNLSNSSTGKVFSDEHKRNISISKSGKNHPMYGKKISNEQIQVLAEGKRRKREALIT